MGWASRPATEEGNDMNEQEAVAWMTKEGMTVRGDIAAILGWTGAIVGTGRAIPDAWIPFLYADKMRPNVK